MKIFRTLLVCIYLTLNMSSCIASTRLGEKTPTYADREIEHDGKEVKDTLQMFIDSNPYAVKVNILSEGTVAYLCADDDNLFIRLSVGNPQLFMRMLMQGLTIYIDPTGGKKEKYAILFPSAADVQTSMANFQPTRNTGFGNSEQSRPDISPLIKEMNKVGVVFDINGKVRKMGESRSIIELETENETLNFYALIPKTQMMTEKKLSSKWSIGIYLDTPSGNLEGPRNDMSIRDQRPPMRNGSSGRFPQMQSGQSEVNKIMRKKINAWSQFSIDDVNNVNLEKEYEE